MGSSDTNLRRIAGLLGLGAAGTGLMILVVPDLYARITGANLAGQAIMRVVYRSLAFRELGTGIGLWSAANHGVRLAPWLRVRALAHGGDAVASAIVLLRGPRDLRVIAFMVMSAMESATAWRLSQSAAELEPPAS